MKHRILLVLTLLVTALLSSAAPVNTQKTDGADRRRAQLVEANIIAVHAFQVLLAKTSGKGDKSCFSPGNLSDAQLSALSDHQASLLKSDPNVVRAWVNGARSTFDPAKDLEP